MKARYNAVKHGIFAKVVLRGGPLREKEAEYENLLESFRESLQPADGLEEYLVEKLAQLAWRRARAVKAEAAIISRQTQFLREDHELHLKKTSQGSTLELAEVTVGTARCRNNPYMLERSMKALETLRDAVTYRGFEPKVDENILKSLYGSSATREELFLTYRIAANRAEEGEKSPEQSRMREKAREEFLEAVEAERKALQEQIRRLEAREEIELPLREESLAIPQEKELDRLLRVEARLDGEFDRTLQQLERLQRMRQGQPVPPTVKVDVSRE